VKLQLLPSTFEDNGAASARQHLTCFVVDDRVAFDAGSLAMASSSLQKQKVRDIVLSHAHLDHIAGLPLFVDDLFAILKEPIRIHATADVIEVLERDVFNWSVYPRFSELTNAHGPVMEYVPFEAGSDFTVQHLSVRAVDVNHKVPASGFLISDENAAIALTGDTAGLSGFWQAANNAKDLAAVLIECAFPDELAGLAQDSHHLTPSGLKTELAKIDCPNCPIYIVNIKPMYREQTIKQIEALAIKNVEILEVGRMYEW
jgi:cAMP phosphodiesterase